MTRKNLLLTYLVEDGGGGGVAICEAVGALDDLREYVLCIFRDCSVCSNWAWQVSNIAILTLMLQVSFPKYLKNWWLVLFIWKGWNATKVCSGDGGLAVSNLHYPDRDMWHSHRGLTAPHELWGTSCTGRIVTANLACQFQHLLRYQFKHRTSNSTALPFLTS